MDMTVVNSLVEMGFPEVACQRAATLTHGQGLEAATQWIMEHMDDPDFLAPLPATPNERGIAKTILCSAWES